jgi:hypothetical protein
MGLLDSLNPINLAKNAAESIVDSVLPDGLKSVGNDLVDVALDFVSGDYGGLAKDVSSFLHDAETAMGPLTTPSAAAPSSPTEPDAPPPADSKTSSTKTTDAKASASKKSGTKTTDITSSSKTDPKTTGETAPTSTPIAKGDSDTSTEKSSSKTDKSTSKSSSSSSSSSKSTSSSDAKDVTKFFAQSDTDLMAAVRDGKLPDAVRDDPAQMQRLQLRMNEISEMNQLISQMLAAMHDMNKAVIQNIRA